jgi:hypothetical protein
VRDAGVSSFSASYKPQTLSGEVACRVSKNGVFKEVKGRHDALHFFFDGLPSEVGSGVWVDL